jgi:hypothetical protein
MKTIFENNGGAYTQVGDYLLPNLSLPVEEKETNIDVWTMRHKRYLKQNHKVRYYNLLTSGKLNSYLADIEEQAQNLFSRLVKDLAEKENVMEKLKSDNPMLWVQKMNKIRNQATEIVNEQVIYR